MCSHRKRGDCSRLEGTERCGPNQYGQHEFTAWQQLPSTFHWGECLAQSCLARGIRKFIFWVQKWVLCIACERTRTPLSSWGSYLCSLACSEQIWVTPFTRSIVSKNLQMKVLYNHPWREWNTTWENQWQFWEACRSAFLEQGVCTGMSSTVSVPASAAQPWNLLKKHICLHVEF